MRHFHEGGNTSLLSLQFNYEEALALYEAHIEVGWLNPKQITQNTMYNMVFKFIQEFEASRDPEWTMLECPTCETVNLKSDWVRNYRRCPNPSCHELHKDILNNGNHHA